MNLFIDTNIFLSFYHMSSDDLEELKKIGVLIRQKKLVLYITDQVVYEFRRNRENKIGDASKRLKDQRLNLQFPQICKDYDEYLESRKLQKKYEEAHIAFLTKINKDVSGQSLKADRIIDTLFNKKKRDSVNLMKKKIPEFKNEDEKRVFWATHDSTGFIDWEKAPYKLVVRYQKN